MTNIRTDIEGLLPLTVSECIVNDPFITLRGQGWSVNVNTRWRLIFPGEVNDSDVDSARVPEALQMLTGRVLTACEIDDGLFDPCFVFDGPRLEVLADTEYDPWVMHLTGYRLSSSAVGLYLIVIGSRNAPTLNRRLSDLTSRPVIVARPMPGALYGSRRKAPGSILAFVGLWQN